MHHGKVKSSSGYWQLCEAYVLYGNRECSVEPPILSARAQTLSEIKTQTLVWLKASELS